MSPAPAKSPNQSPAQAFVAGLLASFRSVFVLVLIGTYIGVGALAHDFGFSLVWVMLSETSKRTRTLAWLSVVS